MKSTPDIDYQELILSLIKDDLIHYRLINLLSEAGLKVDDCYYLNLRDTIFGFMGYGNDHYSDSIFEQYLNLVESVKYLSPLTEAKALEPFLSIFIDFC